MVVVNGSTTSWVARMWDALMRECPNPVMDTMVMDVGG